MDFDDYQEKAVSTAVYPNIGNNIEYPALGLASEAGEVAEAVKKIQRDHGGNKDVSKDKIEKEIGGVLWYCAALAKEFGLSLQDIAELNVGELAQRKVAGTIKGGDVDDLAFVAATYGVPDRNRNLFSKKSIVIPEAGLSIQLNAGMGYGTDFTDVFGSCTLKYGEGCLTASNIRVKADSGFNPVAFRTALKEGRVTTTIAGDVESFTTTPEGNTAVEEFKPTAICVEVATNRPPLSD